MLKHDFMQPFRKCRASFAIFRAFQFYSNLLCGIFEMVEHIRQIQRTYCTDMNESRAITTSRANCSIVVRIALSLNRKAHDEQHKHTHNAEANAEK